MCHSAEPSSVAETTRGKLPQQSAGEVGPQRDPGGTQIQTHQVAGGGTAQPQQKYRPAGAAVPGRNQRRQLGIPGCDSGQPAPPPVSQKPGEHLGNGHAGQIYRHRRRKGKQ